MLNGYIGKGKLQVKKARPAKCRAAKSPDFAAFMPRVSDPLQTVTRQSGTAGIVLQSPETLERSNFAASGNYLLHYKKSTFRTANHTLRREK